MMLLTRFKQIMVFLLLLAPMLAHPASTRGIDFLGKQYKEVASLPDGRWLVLDKHALRLLDAEGKTLHSLDVRAEHLDTRVINSQAGAEVQAVVFDADQQQSWILQVEPQQIRISRKLAPVSFALQSQCLYRDAQQLSHLFMIAKDGQAEQWLLSGKTPVKLRNLALPPEVESCRVDDRQQALYVSEASFGVWRYAANGEGIPERTLVAGRQPRGEITGEVGALAVLPQGLAVIDADDGRIHLLDAQAQVTQHDLRVPKAQALALAGDALLVLNNVGWQAYDLQSLGLGQASLHTATASRQLPLIMPRGQTESVARAGDAADDPAIWVHPTQPARSRIIATNKKQGLLNYNLQGKQVQLVAAGRLNNVDLRQNIRWPGHKPSDLAIATQRDEAALALFALDGQGQLRDVGRIKTGLRDIYGTCLYQPPAGGLEVFANDKDGRFEHYRVEPQAQGGQAYMGKLLRTFRTAGQPEGCVADDQQQRLFYGEEKQGIWTMSASADQPSEPQLIMPVGEHLVADVEGMGLYHGQHGSYLIASSQGNSSFVVLDASAPYAFRGAFRIGINAEIGIDGVSDTDGLEVSQVNFGGVYRQGMLVVQDGYKRLPDGAQNFKLVAWEDIARALHLQ